MTSVIIFSEDDKLELLWTMKFLMWNEWSKLSDIWKQLLNTIATEYNNDNFTSNKVIESLKKLKSYTYKMSYYWEEALLDLCDVYDI